ncbi:hypothetical protein NKR23_g3467 [Pleurostoma richardsiae]|uniref:Zn(2)-C6 fungal-type domain-containing protein n=1 Tax=Pleurostoma richardsiae TaxID=41990 RepID=A0AA38RM99_9PEZI|nr:hypothetical protein NKR23_g3467 [Pleurostoma richardsiae]
MVNHGVSRACGTCRKRRKKCDETKPICKRCADSGRACVGYRDESALYFRHYYVPPKVLPTEESPPSTSAEAEESAEKSILAAFRRDFVVESADRKVSRGFLDGMPELLAAAGPLSELGQAVSIVETAVLGNQQGRLDMIDDAARRYCSLLRSFQTTLFRRETHVNIQTLMTALLLGLYEIVSSNGSSVPKHVAHVRGVCAILLSNESPFDMAGGLQLFRLGNPLLLKGSLLEQTSHGVLCVPTSHDIIQNLDAVLVRCNPLFKRAKTILEDASSTSYELEGLLQASLDIHWAFNRWVQRQSEEWMPKTVHTIGEMTAFSSPHPFCWPGPVDTYLDLYVSAVWNTYRKTHVMLLEILRHTARRLSPNQETSVPMALPFDKLAQELTAALVASIPFHLAPSLSEYIYAITTDEDIPPGRPVGGLLLLHPLYVVGRCSIVPPSVRAYVGRCLAYIGQCMGIGQAALLAEAVRLEEASDRPLLWDEGNIDLPFQQMTEGHILIFAGMLLQPAQVDAMGHEGCPPGPEV